MDSMQSRDKKGFVKVASESGLRGWPETGQVKKALRIESLEVMVGVVQGTVRLVQGACNLVLHDVKSAD